jgi:Uma2 family endonuclease
MSMVNCWRWLARKYDTIVLLAKPFDVLADLAEARGCLVLTENIKVRTKDTKYRYPDVVITCETISDEYMVLEPCALFEVLSESTAETDATTKLEEYLKITELATVCDAASERPYGHCVQTWLGWLASRISRGRWRDQHSVSRDKFETRAGLRRVVIGQIVA